MSLQPKSAYLASDLSQMFSDFVRYYGLLLWIVTFDLIFQKNIFISEEEVMKHFYQGFWEIMSSMEISILISVTVFCCNGPQMKFNASLKFPFIAFYWSKVQTSFFALISKDKDELLSQLKSFPSPDWNALQGKNLEMFQRISFLRF